MNYISLIEVKFKRKDILKIHLEKKVKDTH